jgi:Fe(3+) dicitrate transport protein
MLNLAMQNIVMKTSGIRSMLMLMILLNCLVVNGQIIPERGDTSEIKALDSILIISIFKKGTVQVLPAVKGTYIFAARKTEVINLDKLDVNRVDNNPRQLFSKVPGIFVFETDGSGNQVNISARGLTAHRSWEMNVRQNDVMTNSDLYGYPASHFNPPTESIERIEIVRGSGALQYGAQFGGMVNYITKEADSLKAISFESQNSIGSYGLFSTYNAIGGKTKKVQYYAYANYRQSDGYRDNSEYKYFAGHAHLQYMLSPSFRLRLEYNYMDYRNHINGGLTDAQFRENPGQSTRDRNYYSPTIHVPSIRFDYDVNKNLSLNFISSAILGSRNSVQFIALSTVPDTLNTSLGTYNPRQVDIDVYNSYANEIRARQTYTLFGRKHTLVGGLRYINNYLIRKQQGKGTTGFDYDLSLTDPQWGRDLGFKTESLAVFAENLFMLTPELMFTAGLRFENGETRMNGTIKNFDPATIPVNIKHNFALFGFGAQYQLGERINIYANWSQAYRPVIFADVIPTTTLNKIDPGIKDAFGHNAEIGIRGKLRNYLGFQVTLFDMMYKNRTGNLVLTDNNGNAYFYKTNTGNTRSGGIEIYAEIQPINWLTSYRSKLQLSIYTSTSYIHARYIKGSVVSGGINKDISGNQVEAAPRWISRNGVQLVYKGFSTTLQYSFVGQAYSDPLNTENPNASGTVGIVPGYQLVDLNFTWRFRKHYNIKLLMNNLFNKQYFTERPAFFPGPGGLYPSDGSSLILSFGLVI